MDTKICASCGNDLPATLEYFYKNNRMRSGLSSWCRECTKRIKRESNQRVREKDPDKYIERRREYVRKYRERHPERVKKSDRRRSLKKFGITPEEYDRMLSNQGGKCFLCNAESEKNLAVDHDHLCCEGKKSCGNCIRALLCANCNTALGLVGDDIQILKKMIEYIQEFRCQ